MNFPLRTALAASCKFWYVVFPLSLVSRHCKISLSSCVSQLAWLQLNASQKACSFSFCLVTGNHYLPCCHARSKTFFFFFLIKNFWFASLLRVFPSSSLFSQAISPSVFPTLENHLTTHMLTQAKVLADLFSQGLVRRQKLYQLFEHREFTLHYVKNC